MKISFVYREDIVVTVKRSRICVERFTLDDNPVRLRMSAAEGRQLADALHDAADRIESETDQ